MQLGARGAQRQELGVAVLAASARCGHAREWLGHRKRNVKVDEGSLVPILGGDGVLAFFTLPVRHDQQTAALWSKTIRA